MTKSAVTQRLQARKKLLSSALLTVANCNQITVYGCKALAQSDSIGQWQQNKSVAQMQAISAQT
eukprot:18551-Heterococcus_DN1.PRE.3